VNHQRRRGKILTLWYPSAVGTTRKEAARPRVELIYLLLSSAPPLSKSAIALVARTATRTVTFFTRNSPYEIASAAAAMRGGVKSASLGVVEARPEALPSVSWDALCLGAPPNSPVTFPLNARPR